LTPRTPSYLAYGLVISSPLALHAPTARTAMVPDVVVCRAKLECPFTTATGSGVGARVTADGIYLSCAEAGTFLVRNGTEIIVDPVPGVPDSLVRLYLAGPVFAALLRQRELLVLHASAVAIGDEAVVFLGGHGWGKSTTAGALWARGHDILADDVVAVAETESGPIVMPGFPWLKLWPDASRALGADPARLPRVHPALEKRDLRMADGHARKPAPVDRVYVLAVDDGPSIEDLPPQAALIELLRHAYGGQSLQSVQTGEHFLRCASLARSVPIRRLATGRSLTALADLARLVESDGVVAIT
jgi:hypothetical protein